MNKPEFTPTIYPVEPYKDEPRKYRIISRYAEAYFPCIKNPDRRWWQLWKRRWVIDPRFSSQ